MKKRKKILQTKNVGTFNSGRTISAIVFIGKISKFIRSARTYLLHVNKINIVSRYNFASCAYLHVHVCVCEYVLDISCYIKYIFIIFENTFFLPIIYKTKELSIAILRCAKHTYNCSVTFITRFYLVKLIDFLCKIRLDIHSIDAGGASNADRQK